MAYNIKTAIDECANHAAEIRRRNKTLIEYYIYPGPIPTAIDAYDPRLVTLQNRLSSIKQVNFRQLELLVDDPDCLAASHLNSIITELLNAIFGYKRLFEERYDPTLRQRAQYATTIHALELLRIRLHELIQTRQSNLNRPRAEHLLAHHESNSSSSSPGYQFCRGAVQVLNDNDHGLLANVSDKDLLSSNHATLSSQGGAFLWWVCPSARCAFKLRFHILGSQTSSVHNNSEIRSHPSIPLHYRSTFLIKSHLHTTSERPGTTKYGCLFCFAEGKPLHGGSSAFTTGRELAVHLCGAHKGRKLPAAMVLEKMKIAIDGQCPIGVRRWDANFLTT